MTYSGMLSMVVGFDQRYPANGWHPGADLVQGSDGNIYGTTEGGLWVGGTLFRIAGIDLLRARLMAAQYLPDAGFRFVVSGKGSEPCAVEVSTNLVDWDFAATLTDTNETIDFIDSAATNMNGRFYRAVRR